MRCKPGDLAIVIEGEPAGVIIRVTHWSDEVSAWRFDGTLIFDGKQATAIEDECLRPIRDPGDDAVDEMVDRLGAAQECAVRDERRRALNEQIERFEQVRQAFGRGA